MSNLDYGVIGNCQSAALISKTGSIDWLCFPKFDSPSVFAKILDKKKGGSFGFEVSEDYQIFQSYFRDTNILRTRFASPEGAFEVFDFMPRYKTGEGATEYYLPAELYRYIRYISGSPKFKIIYEPAFDYAREVVNSTIDDGFIRTESSSSEGFSAYLYSDLSLNFIFQRKEISLEKDAFLLFSCNQKLITIDIERVYLEYSRTKVYWLNWVNRSKKYDKYNSELTRSLLVLKMMSFQPSGAVLAAVTTSIPESIGDVRNWDYRFCWLRDSSMLIETLISMGHQGAARLYLGFIKRILKNKKDRFQIMYGINGERKLKEEELPHLEGFKGSSPVRIGNDAYNQKQNDSLGYLMDVIYQHYVYFPGTLAEIEDMWELVKTITNIAFSEWRKPDHGIWEFRDRKQNFVFSKVMCWVTLDRAIKIAEYLNMQTFANNWRVEANIIREEVLEKGWKEEIGCFSQAYENFDYDASVLLLESYGFIDADDERYVRTVKAIKANLMKNGLMFRYKSKDDFGKPKSAFTICSFWMIRALFVIGEREEAEIVLRDIFNCSNHLGLFSEDLDFETKAQLGNFPQAYSHLALINTIKLFSSEKNQSRFIRP
ncbi:MAG TPA: glycoside hydrolase family 15 protein [Rikenellaceae bacterium]|nr:glycoside hydrolase family 15 protein [Rikenellaceae bacterium]